FRASRFLCPTHCRDTGYRSTRADTLHEVGIGGLMETSAPEQSASDRYPRAASPIHMILVLAAIGGWAIGHKIFVYQLSATANPNRVRYYVVTIFYEWLLFVLVVAGGRGGGAPLSYLFGRKC